MIESNTVQGLIERERLVLQHIIQSYVLTANPVGSRTISKHLELGLSPASIRNIMSDLEEQGFITHPHTSAGRIPTDKGYRFYVDSIMQVESLTAEEKEFLDNSVETSPFTEYDEIFKESSKILSKISHQISVVSVPQLQHGILHHVELISISSNRVMVVLSIASGFVKTMMFEIDSSINTEYLEKLSSILNERLAGLSLQEIRQTCADRFRDATNEKSGLIRLFVIASDKLFSTKPNIDKIHIDGMQDVVQQPEFYKPENMRTIIELVEDEKIIVHILESRDQDQNITITIGKENNDNKLQEFSLITSKYFFGHVQGTIGLIGPRRMQYSKLISIVEYISRLMTEKYAA